MAGPWDARAWVASVLGCKRDELSILGDEFDYTNGRQVWYAKDGEQVARLIVAGPIRPLDRKPEGHWVVAVELADLSTQSPPEDVPESTEIQA